MRPLVSFVALCLIAGVGPAAERPWQELTNPTAAEVAAHFATPPPEYGLTIWWGWDGAITPEVINRDLDAFQAKGIRVVTIEAGYGMSAPYLSPGWFETIKLAVEAARQRNMRVWLVDEGKYPSGFADGKFSRERPELRMQALVVGERIAVNGGETVVRQLAPDTVGALAVNQADHGSRVSRPAPATCAGLRRRGNGRSSSSSTPSEVRRPAPSTIPPAARTTRARWRII